MIIVNIMGGLGNQMFQYAAARHLSILNDTDLRIDSSNFDGHTPNKEHTLQIDRYRIAAPEATPEEKGRFLKFRKKRRGLTRFLEKMLGPSSTEAGSAMYYEEPSGSRFRQEFFHPSADRYLFGYFNSYKYFDPIRKLLMGEFVPREDLSRAAKTTLEKIENSDSVGIHFRRGDYVEDPKIHAGVKSILTEEYYRNAIALVTRRIGNPHAFVFSDDIGWVKENFSLPFETTHVGFNPPQRGYEDLWLMSRCRHNITAGGSSFSWWAAYLNPNEEKIVVRTKDVNGDPEFNHPDDFFPPDWSIAAS